MEKLSELATGPTHIYLVGVGCVGKTAVGARLAEILGVKFIEFDKVITETVGKPIGRIRQQYLTGYSFRLDHAPILKKTILDHADESFVLDLAPSGVMDTYWRLLKKQERAIIVAVLDKPENILKRITFYDDDDHLIEPKLTDKKMEKLLKYQLSEIKGDIRYFGRTYKRANLHVDLDGAGIEDAAKMIERAVKEFVQKRSKRGA
ncbi:MAG: hypothetical protein HY815_10040 [Candidatus Riflebacteria bacterium]|nr:hypothetical protein [Candidatus Riflebacteria bacterium]